MVETVLENKDAMVQEIDNWDSLFNRLNATCLAMKFFIFTDHEDEEKGNKMNVLWRIFFENMKMINHFSKEGKLDPGEVSEDQEELFTMHKEFFMFLFNDMSPKMNEDTNFDEMKEYLQYNFENIYGHVDFYMFLKDTFRSVGPESRINQEVPKQEGQEVADLPKVKDPSSVNQTNSESLTKNLREDHLFSKETNSSQQKRLVRSKQGTESKLEEEEVPIENDVFGFEAENKPKKIRSVENTEDVFSSVKGQGRLKHNKSKSSMVNTNFNDFDEYDMGKDQSPKAKNDPFADGDVFAQSKTSNKSKKKKQNMDFNDFGDADDPFANQEPSKAKSKSKNNFDEVDPFAVKDKFKKKKTVDKSNDHFRNPNEEFFISNTVKQKQIGRIKEVQSDVFDSEQFYSEGDNRQYKDSKKYERKRKDVPSLKIVDEEKKSGAGDDSDYEGKFELQKPKKTPRTFGEVVDLESTQDNTRYHYHLFL